MNDDKHLKNYEFSLFGQLEEVLRSAIDSDQIYVPETKIDEPHTKDLNFYVTEAAERINDYILYKKPEKQTNNQNYFINEEDKIKIKFAEPLLYENEQLSIDLEKLTNIVSNKTIDQFLKTRGYDNIYGGGAVGIKTENVDGERIPILKSVNDIIFKGDGVTVTREGKNIEVNIPGASVVAGDPTIDFARESTIVEIYSQLQTIYSLVQNIAGLNFVENYPDGIGGATGTWQAY